jgi:TRAP-type transport system periplasmic protein
LFFSRQRFIRASVAGTVTAGFLRYPADAAEFVYKYACDPNITHPLGQAAVWWAAQVQRESAGQINIEVFPNGQLGSGPRALIELRAGAIEFFHYGGPSLGDFVRVAAINGVAFAFARYDAVFRAIDGELGAYVRSEIRNAGLHVFDRQYDDGYRQVTTSARPINTPADMKGLKFRVPTGKIYSSCFAALGTSPTALPLPEVYVALQTHLVDGQENPLVMIEDNKFYEVQKYVSMTNHMWDGWWLLGNMDAWNRLPKKLQEIVSRNYDRSVTLERTKFQALYASLERTLRSQGMIFSTPDEAPFRVALRTAGYYSQWKDTFGDKGWSLLEKYAGKLA